MVEADPPRSAADGTYMRRALRLARRGLGRVAPNPLVGAVVVRDGRVVGEGWHAEFGGDHAEVAALAEAGDRAAGGTLYVSLEPCDHAGKTPPCTEAVLASGVGRVVVACRDPSRRPGAGLERLRGEGVEVTEGVEAAEAIRLNAPFLWRAVTGAPFVALKLALSLDGRISAREGERTEVTGQEAAAFVHGLRAAHGAVLVGRSTAVVDDPRLTARGEVTPRRPPERVVLDSRLRTPADARLFRTADRTPTRVFCAPDAPEGRRRELTEAGVQVEEVPPAGDREGLSLEAVLERLGEAGVGSVLVEGGGRVAASFLREDRVHRMHLLYAPVAYGPEGVPGFPGVEVPPGRWEPGTRRALGRDTLLTLELGRVLRELESACTPGEG